MKILISPYSRKLRNGKNNPKNYPYWQELIDLFIRDGHQVVQLGTGDEVQFNEVIPAWGLPLDLLQVEIENCNFWMSVDNFLPHMVFSEKIRKPGVVFFGRSDPNIYGYKMNLNILKGRDFLRPDQFNIWEAIEYDPNIYFTAGQVYDKLQRHGFLKT